MSRIGKLPIAIPSAVEVKTNHSAVVVKGPKGTLEKSFPSFISFERQDDQLIVHSSGSGVFVHAMRGTVRSIVAGMVKGVQELYVKDLEIQGTGFKAILKDRVLDLSLGFSHPLLYTIPIGIEVLVTDNGTKLKITGPDKQMVGQVAAHIKQYYPVEPYKGKGVRILGQFIRRKEGKKSA
jgi:large subunit ribosomal protein L6